SRGRWPTSSRWSGRCTASAGATPSGGSSRRPWWRAISSSRATTMPCAWCAGGSHAALRRGIRSGSRARPPTERSADGQANAQGERHDPRGRVGRSRRPAPLCAARRSRADRHPLRLRTRPVRRVHRARQRPGGALVHRPGAIGGRAGRCHDRGPGLARAARSAAGRVHRRAGRAVRILHRGHGHERARPPRPDAAAEREAGARRAGRQPVPLRQPRAGDPGGAPRCRREARGAVMTPGVSRRSFLAAGGVLIVGLGLDGLGRAGAQSIPDADRFLGKSLAPDAVDSFLAVHRDGSATIFVGRVDLGTGGRIAMRQIAGEELDIPLERIAMIEGDTALTPNQGGTGGIYGIARGGSQLRLAAATARRGLVDLAAQRLGRPAGDLEVADGVVRGKDGTGSVSYGELIGDRAFNLKVDAAAPLKSPDRFRFIGKSLPRPDVPEKVTGHHRYLHDLTLPGMLHARVVHPPAFGATLVSVDEASIAGIAGARTVRMQSFLAVVAEREWDALRAARALKTQWGAGTGLPDHAKEFDAMRTSRVVRDQEVARKGDLAALSAPPAGTRTLAASYRWPMQT